MEAGGVRSDGFCLRGDTRRVSWRDRVGFDGSSLHVGDQLLGDLSQNVFSQPCHAEHVVTGPVHVVSERNELLGHEKKRSDSFFFHNPVLQVLISRVYLNAQY